MKPVSLSVRSLSLSLTLFVLFLGLFTPRLMAADITPEVAISTLEATQVGFRSVHNKIAPAVVSIASRMEVTSTATSLLSGTPQVQNASGSGVIIREDGIVLTNVHVVKDATKVTVKLNGGDDDLPAEVVQMDTRTDLAIVRITRPGKYPVAALGDASTVQVGDWAIAFGSPFRLASTMTVGIISATGRNLPQDDGSFSYNDLLQTDASINPGNSGGALVNIRGEVIGINFMIYSPGDSAGSVGIGFAIPINDYTKEIINTLTTGKPMERGRLGVSVGPLSNVMRDQYGVPTGGAFVEEVIPGMPAEKGGVLAEDVITDFNGTAVKDVNQFVRLIERTKPGSVVTIQVMRKKKIENLTVTVGAIPVAAKNALSAKNTGLSVVTLSPELITRLGATGVKYGVVVTDVVAGTAADDAGLREGDIILSIGSTADRVDIRNADDFWAELSKRNTPTSKGQLLLIKRGTRTRMITFPKIDTK